MAGHELWLPEPAIERIQDFLDTKRAAKTMILSKSWHNVWLLRPNLVFDHIDHIPLKKYPHDDLSKEAKRELYAQQMKQFLEFADNTLNRYEKSNLKIKRFRLSFYQKYFPYGGTWDYGLQHTDLILRALKLGATHITLHLNYYYSSGTYVLPDEVFEFAETLTVIKCGINPNLQLTCSRLRSLSLDEFEFPNDLDSISNILLSCPLLQKMSLYYLSLHKPRNYYYDNYPTNDTGYITKPLMHLTTLVLKDVYFDMLFLGDLSSKFPLLKDLTLLTRLKKHQEDIRISSTSLERLYFKIKNSPTRIRLNHPYKRQRVTLDFPSIRKFTYMGSVIPLLSLESNSKGWESHVSIRRRNKHLTASWFRRLSDLLTKLRPSKVSLSLRVRPVKSFDYEVGVDIQGLPISEIENLTIDHKKLPSLACYALLDVLFHMCHPKLITQCVSKCFRVKKKHIELLGHILLNGLLLNHEKTMLTRSQFMYGLNDLKEARAQIIDKAALISTRRDVYLPLDALLDHLKSAKGKQEVRFHLNWEPMTTSTRGNQPYSSS